ncbi:MAG: tryptophan-rich sensory protein [Candidatus Saccharibacteria bacterium]|nr:tryptophan-rich sensory protein [Candidatus Saccharibacteria bacterium]
MWLQKLFSKKVKEQRGLKWAVAGAVVATIAVNAYANIARLGGANMGEVSASYPNLFTPTGLTFSIWSVIYVLLLAYAVYQFTAVRKKAGSKLDEGLFTAINPWLLASCVANIGWMFAWHFRAIWLSMVCMVVLLVSLVMVARRLYAAFTKPTTWQDYLWVRLPIMVYVGWISVATIANSFALAVSLGWNGMGADAGNWLAFALIGGALIGLVAMWWQRDAAYGAVFVWAYGGILVKHLSENGHNGAYPSAIALLCVLVAVLAMSSLYIGVQQWHLDGGQHK